MKKLLLLIIVITISQTAFSQKVYNAVAGEMIFGFSDASYTADGSGILGNNSQGSIAGPMRWTVWFHLGFYTHYDFSKNVGLYTGIVNRNIGFITDERPSDSRFTDKVKWKRRSYTLGIPLAIKIGNLEKGMYVFFGGQYDMFYHYKEKEFLPDGKRKNSQWFSDKVNLFIPSVFAGITFPGGMSVKVTYELNDMMNTGYTTSDAAGNLIKPYENMTSRLIYTSVYTMLSFKESYMQVTKEEKKLMAESY